MKEKSFLTHQFQEIDIKKEEESLTSWNVT